MEVVALSGEWSAVESALVERVFFGEFFFICFSRVFRRLGFRGF